MSSRPDPRPVSRTVPRPVPPDRLARIAGALYLLLTVVGPFSLMYVPSTLIVAGDPAATAANLSASEGLFRLGLLGDAVIFLAEIPLVIVLYLLFEPVSRAGSMVAAAARGAMAVVQGMNLVGGLAALVLVGGAGYLAAFSPGQLHALLLLALDVRGAGALVWEAFFAFHCFVLAWLIFRSGFLPKWLGPLMAIAALGYLGDSVGTVLFPDLQATFAALVGIGAMVGEIPFMLWLLIRGVREVPDTAPSQ